MYKEDFLYCNSEILKQTNIKEDKRINRNNPDDLIMLHNELDYSDEYDNEEYNLSSSNEFEDAEYVLPTRIPLKSDYTLQKFFIKLGNDFIEYSLQLHIYFKNVDPSCHLYWKKYFKKINELWKNDFSKIVKNKLKNEKLIILHF